MASACILPRCIGTLCPASSRQCSTGNFTLGRACQSVLHATNPSNSGRVCEITSCRGPARRRTLCVQSPPGTLSNSSSEMLQLQELRREVQGSLSTQLAKKSAFPSAQILQNRCVVCGFWTPDHTKVKSHIRQAHPQVWQEIGEAAGALCAGHSVQTSQSCPFCRRKVHDKKKHPQQCVVLFQVCLCWLRAHPPSKSRGPGPAPSTTAGTRSLKRFLQPANTESHDGLSTSCTGAASAAPRLCGRRHRSS